jgi:hypothetical protein
VLFRVRCFSHRFPFEDRGIRCLTPVLHGA